MTKEKKSKSIRIKIKGEAVRQVQAGIPVRDLLPQKPTATKTQKMNPVLGALVDHDTCSLSYPLQTNAELKWLRLEDREGIRIFKRSLCFLLGKALKETFPKAVFSIEHALGPGLFTRFTLDGKAGMTQTQLSKLDHVLKNLVKQDLPIERIRISFKAAWEKFEKTGDTDKLNLLRYSNPPRLTVFRCGKYEDLYNGVLADSTGALKPYRLRSYKNGIVIQFPERQEDGQFKINRFDPQKNLFEIFEAHRSWGAIVGLNTLGDLNEKIASRHLPELALTTEAMHEKRLGRIADNISKKKGIKWILIAGPSCSGKTTTAKKLAIHLQVNGLRPVSIECDNYFVDRDKTPKDADGSLDFEHVEAIDLKLFNRHLERISQGKRVELPRYNFHKGKQEKSGKFLELEDDQIVIIEGIHCLNPRLTACIPRSQKFLLYISCLTQLRLDSTNRLSTTDMRLIRRIVRDNQFRGHSALKTVGMWPSVRRGEKKWIFPFQKQANMTFNSSLEYELAIFAPYALPLLKEIKPFHPEYAEARRLQDLLELVHPGESDSIPRNSVLREFIGGSVFSEEH